MYAIETIIALLRIRKIFGPDPTIKSVTIMPYRIEYRYLFKRKKTSSPFLQCTAAEWEWYNPEKIRIY
jgi:hypothetical protein